MGAATERADLLQVHRRRCVRRWWYRGAGHATFEAHVSLGWLPDGRWWVDDTRERLGWIFTATSSAVARAAAQDQAEALMAAPGQYPGGRWEPDVAEHEPGVLPPRASAVPEWPFASDSLNWSRPWTNIAARCRCGPVRRDTTQPAPRTTTPKPAVPTGS